MKGYPSYVLPILAATSASAFVQPIPNTIVGSSTRIRMSTVDDKTEVREYFNTEGFNRWNKIYSESDEVNDVQVRSIRFWSMNTPAENIKHWYGPDWENTLQTYFFYTKLDIRKGHDQTIQKILKWVDNDANSKGRTFCDCGCGVGSLAIPLALRGKRAFVEFCHCLRQQE